MKSKESGPGLKTISVLLAAVLTAGPGNAKEAAKKVKDILKKGTDKDAPALVNNVQGKAFHIVEHENFKNLKGKEAKESQEFDDWGFPHVEVESYQDVLKELMSKELYKFLEEKSKEDGKQYPQYLDIEGQAFIDFVKYIKGHTAIKDNEGKVVKTVLSQNPDKIAKYTPAGGSSEKIKGFKEWLKAHNANIEDFKQNGFQVSNLKTINANLSNYLEILNEGKETVNVGREGVDIRTKAHNAEGVVTQKPVLDSLNRIGNNIEQYYIDLRENSVEPCILGTEFLIEDVAMMIKYFGSKGISTSPDANGKHKPERITLKDWRDIQDKNPQFQTQSYNSQRAQETAAKFGAMLVPEGQKVTPSIVDVE